MGTAAVSRKRIPFVIEHPAGAEVYGPLQRGQSRSLAGKPVEYPGLCRCCSGPVTRHEVNPEYLESLGEFYSSSFVATLCVTNAGGRVFWPRNCHKCDRRGERI